MPTELSAPPHSPDEDMPTRLSDPTQAADMPTRLFDPTQAADMPTRLFDPTQAADMPTRLFDPTQADLPTRLFGLSSSAFSRSQTLLEPHARKEHDSALLHNHALSLSLKGFLPARKSCFTMRFSKNLKGVTSRALLTPVGGS